MSNRCAGINDSPTLTNRLAKTRPTAAEQKVLANPEVPRRQGTPRAKADYSLSSQDRKLFVSWKLKFETGSNVK
jgi:hypothetical protein